jgi:hypothetical protein
MAVRTISGRDGFVEIDGALVGGLDEWEWTESMKTEEGGSFGSIYADPLESIISGKIACKGKWARGDGSGQGGVETKFRVGDTVALTLAESGESGETYVVNALLTEVKRGAKWQGGSVFEFSAEQRGAPTSVASHA